MTKIITGNNNYLKINLSVFLFLFIILVLNASQSVKSQETWNLTKCIDYALKNNIDLNIINNEVSKQKIDLVESKAKLLPDLNLGSGFNANFGRNIDGSTNNITYNQTITNNYWINSSFNIFQGFVKQNSIGFNKLLLYASNEEALVLKNKLYASIITAYYIVIYCIEIKNVAQSQVNLSEMQYNRMQKIVDIGKESPISAQDLKSQLASDKLNLTLAENNMNKYLLELKQLVRINANQDFKIDTLNVADIEVNNLENIDSIYNVAVNFLPEIKKQEYLLKASKKGLAVAKGGVSPQIYLSAGIYTNYFDGDKLAYKNQLTNNQNQQINMGIVIPIFNQASVYSSIKRNQIAVCERNYEMEKQKDILYTEIVKAVDELHSAENEYKSSAELLEFSWLTFQNVTKKLEKGLAGTTDYEVAKQRFMNAKVALLKAKLIYVMHKQILEFYKTGNWNHLYK